MPTRALDADDVLARFLTIPPAVGHTRVLEAENTLAQFAIPAIPEQNRPQDTDDALAHFIIPRGHVLTRPIDDHNASSTFMIPTQPIQTGPLDDHNALSIFTIPATPLHSMTRDDNREFSDCGIPESNETSPNTLFRGQQMRCKRTALSFIQPCPSSKKRPDIQSDVDWSEDVLTKFNIPFAPSLNTLSSTISDDYPMSDMTLHTSPHLTSHSQVERDMSDSQLAHFRIPPIPVDKRDVPMKSKNQANEVFYDNDLSPFEIPPIPESMKGTCTVASSETSLSWDDDSRSMAHITHVPMPEMDMDISMAEAHMEKNAPTSSPSPDQVS